MKTILMILIIIKKTNMNKKHQMSFSFQLDRKLDRDYFLEASYEDLIFLKLGLEFLK
jgi:hypothetical protein